MKLAIFDKGCSREAEVNFEISMGDHYKLCTDIASFSGRSQGFGVIQGLEKDTDLFGRFTAKRDSAQLDEVLAKEVLAKMPFALFKRQYNGAFSSTS